MSVQVSECFTIGSTVAVTTMHDDLIEGQVMAFDLSTKLLILKTNSENVARHNNVYIVNLLLCKDINVKKEVNGTDQLEPQSINLQKLSSRIRNQVEQKKRLVSALKANVSEEAQNLFLWLGKMLTSSEVQWDGQDIVVFKDVYIRAPYQVENVEVKQAGRQRELDYVKKLVMNRQQQMSSSATSSASSSESSSLKN